MAQRGRGGGESDPLSNWVCGPHPGGGARRGGLGEVRVGLGAAGPRAPLLLPLLPGLPVVLLVALGALWRRNKGEVEWVVPQTMAGLGVCEGFSGGRGHHRRRTHPREGCGPFGAPLADPFRDSLRPFGTSQPFCQQRFTFLHKKSDGTGRTPAPMPGKNAMWTWSGRAHLWGPFEGGGRHRVATTDAPGLR